LAAIIKSEIDALVERICELGCSRVNEIIEDINSGETPDELISLDSRQIRDVTKELVTIMSVYDENQGLDSLSTHRLQVFEQDG